MPEVGRWAKVRPYLVYIQACELPNGVIEGARSRYNRHPSSPVQEFSLSIFFSNFLMRFDSDFELQAAIVTALLCFFLRNHSVYSAKFFQFTLVRLECRLETHHGSCTVWSTASLRTDKLRATFRSRFTMTHSTLSFAKLEQENMSQERF